jgi:chemotaxis protein CheZ
MNAFERDAACDAMYQRVGQLTRTLHDALHELGYDRKLAAAAESLPDARDRLDYIATLTGKAAERVLGAVEAAQVQQNALESDTRALARRWDGLAATTPAGERASLEQSTRAFLGAASARTAATNAYLTEIMLAQDFHDLTGQVIKRIAEIARSLEANLLALLLETRCGEPAEPLPALSGPAIRSSADTVSSQAEVDSLLESLGF